MGCDNGWSTGCSTHLEYDTYNDILIARNITEWKYVEDKDYEILKTATLISTSKVFGWRIIEQVLDVQETIDCLLEEARLEYEEMKKRKELEDIKKKERAEKKKKEMEEKRKQLEKLKKELGEWNNI